RFTMTAPSDVGVEYLVVRCTRTGIGYSLHFNSGFANTSERKSCSRACHSRAVQRKRCCESVETELAIQIAARTSVEVIEGCHGPEHPCGIDKLAEGSQFLSERRVAENRLSQLGREFEEVREQAIKSAKLVFEQRVTIFGESGGVCEKLGETLTSSGAFE